MNRAPIRASATAAAVLALILAAAAPASATTPAADAPDVADVAIPAASAPKAKDCTLRGTLNTWVSGKTVACSAKHTGITVWVSTWPSTTSPSAADKLTPGSGKEKRFAEEMAPAMERCRSKVVAYLGSGREGFWLASRLSQDVSGPDADQWKRGERWLRCDVVLPLREKASRVSLQDLRPLGSFKGLYADLLNVFELPAEARGTWTCMVEGEWRDFVSCATSRKGLLIELLEFTGRDVGWRGSTKATTDAAGKVCALFLSQTRTPDARTSYVSWDREIARGTLDGTVFSCLIPHSGGR